MIDNDARRTTDSVFLLWLLMVPFTIVLALGLNCSRLVDPVQYVLYDLDSGERPRALRLLQAHSASKYDDLLRILLDSAHDVPRLSQLITIVERDTLCSLRSAIDSASIHRLYAQDSIELADVLAKSATADTMMMKLSVQSFERNLAYCRYHRDRAIRSIGLLTAHCRNGVAR